MYSFTNPKIVIIPLPSHDFDPTECAVPWKILTQNGVKVRFATPEGQVARCDLRMLFGQGLGLLAPLLAADKNGKAAYEALEQSHEFRNPCKWSEIQAHVYDGIILPGGHASGMKEYLESEILKKIIEDFFLLNKPIGAICHGVVLVARTLTSGKSVLTNRKTTSLLARQELLAWGLTKIWLGDYYRTYPQTVEGEVRSVLNSQDGFLPGPMPILRDHPLSLSRGFTVRDQNYLSARWPGDAHRFGRDFLEMVKN